MTAAWKRWSGSPLAVRILICMALGILVGLVLHRQDSPVPKDEATILQDALTRVDGMTPAIVSGIDADKDGTISEAEWNSWLQTERARTISVSAGAVDPSDLQAWEESGALTASVLDRAEIVAAQVRDGLGVAAGADGQLDRYELEKWIEGLSADDAEVLAGVRATLEEVKGGRGRKLAGLFAIAGDLFLGLIRSIVVPLVFIAVFVGVAGNDDVATVKKVGFGILIYFLCTTVVAVSLGSGLAMLIKPGEGMPPDFREKGMAGAPEVVVDKEELGIRETVQGFIPGNLFGSLSNGATLDIVLFAALFGAVTLLLRESRNAEYRMRANSLVSLGNFIMEICMMVVRCAMLLAPIGVFGLMTDITAQVGLDVLSKLTKYVFTVLAGLVGLLVFYGVIVAVIARRSPLEFFSKIWELQLLAFSTSSSAAVMPRSLETAEQKLGVHKAISRFTIPLGTTVNMDGTALYQAVGAIFLMQVFGVPITFGVVAAIIGTAVMASIGTPGMPGVGIIVLAGILESNGVPATGIALIFGVDRILDMCRTAVNVTGDQCACLVMERVVGKKLIHLNSEDTERELAT